VAEPLGLKQIFFTAAQLLFRVFTIINVRKQDIPTDNATFSVAQREAAAWNQRYTPSARRRR
jgi:hypothetical protein